MEIHDQNFSAETQAAHKLKSDSEVRNFVLEFKPNWHQRLARFLFPSGYCEWPECKPEDEQVLTATYVKFNWLDRLRVLVSGRICVTTKTALLKEKKLSVTHAVSFVRCPSWMSDIHDES